ncbi:MAG: DUF1800 family protein [Acidobacteria bacterium]|nr:DUF1800 family protein [Acidobacteriota bacterium]
MVIMKSQFILRVFMAFCAFCLVSIPAVAQLDDTDPNSPSPVLMRAVEAKRILAVSADGVDQPEPSAPGAESFPPNARVAVFIQNIRLMDGEGANAFRVMVEDSRGRTYRFPVVDVYRLNTKKPMYGLIFELRDDIGYWDEPATGDILIRVSWRGMTSDRGRLGYGETGGSLKDDEIPFSRIYAYNPPASAPASTKTKRRGDLDEPQYVGYRWSGDRMRLLEQAGFGPTSALDSRIRRIGLRIWLEEQFAAPYPSASNPYPNQPLKPTNAPADCDNDQTVTPDVPVTCFRDTYSMYPIQTWNSKEMLYGDNQLRHKIAWALSQIWVTSGNDIQQSRHMVEWHKILSNNAFGNYRTLMKQMTLDPTMGEYLDMVRSTRNNPNENYAREIKQLFTIGLFMLNQDGTIQCVEHNPCQAGDTPAATYDQNVVNNLTKVFTGWNFCNQAASCPNIVVGTVNYIDPLLLNPGITNVSNQLHDLTAKTLLTYPGSTTTNIAACANCTTMANIATYANNSMDQAIDNIFNHPSLGPYIGKILIQQLVTSDPTPAYVSRVAAVFNNNGTGVRGDMKSVIRAILLDPEARGDAKTDPNYGKLREPVQFATNYLRAFGVRSADRTTQSDGYLLGRGEYTGMGQIPFQSPTVFNYYPPSYVIPGTSRVGPEFALMTTGTAIQRSNFINRLTFTNGGTAPDLYPLGIPVNPPNTPNGTSIDVSDLQALSAADATGNLLVDELNRRMLHGTMAAQMKSTILPVVTSVAQSNPATTAQTLSRVQQAIYLVATSSQYQVQR